MIDINNWAINFAAAFLVLLVVALAELVIERALKRAKKPTRIALLTALDGYAKEALAGAATVAEKVLADGQLKLEAIDKKAVADKFYTLLPPAIVVDGALVPIGQLKRLVSQAEWEQLVESAATELDAKVSQNEAWLKAEISKLTAPPSAG